MFSFHYTSHRHLNIRRPVFPQGMGNGIVSNIHYTVCLSSKRISFVFLSFSAWKFCSIWKCARPWTTIEKIVIASRSTFFFTDNNVEITAASLMSVICFYTTSSRYFGDIPNVRTLKQMLLGYLLCSLQLSLVTISSLSFLNYCVLGVLIFTGWKEKWFVSSLW